MDSEDFIAIAY